MNGFCIADDPEGVELGVKFQTTQPVTMTGMRLYRADPGPLRAALWSPDGTRLAQVDLPAADLPFENGWQDVTFPSPLASTPGTTYIASYYTGSARYAYEHGFFADSDYSVGPLVALQSVQGDGNGVFCYGGESCFPDDTFRDSNYWVTPLWSYDFAGFDVVSETEWIEAKAGRAIPVDFSLGDDFGLGVLADGYPRMERIACTAGLVTLTEIATADAAGASGLTYNAETQQYHYVWKTPKKRGGQLLRVPARARRRLGALVQRAVREVAGRAEGCGCCNRPRGHANIVVGGDGESQPRQRRRYSAPRPLSDPQWPQ